MSIDAHTFRQLFASLPSVVAIVTAAGNDGLPCGMTCNTVSAVSIDPPLLLVCVDRSAHTLGAITESGGFVVNVLAAGRSDVSRRFAQSRDDKFAALTFVASSHARGAPVLVDDIAASAECLVYDAIDAGDHRVILGRIERAELRDELPLTYFCREYDAWPTAWQLSATGR
jgi:flavin reductase (DIM6/NTAB) family NADH-FMN oxidoreductase RutF